VRDYCSEQTKGLKGAHSEFRQGWIKLVVDHLNDARTLERRLYYGITGRDVPSLGDHELPIDDEHDEDSNEPSNRPQGGGGGRSGK
jgi:hypothetical protein